MSSLTKKLSNFDIEIKKQEISDKRVKYRFVTVILLSIAILFQIAAMVVILLLKPDSAHHMTGIIVLSLPATIGAIGAYIGISAYKKTD